MEVWKQPKINGVTKIPMHFVQFTKCSKGVHNHSAHVCNARNASCYLKLLLRQFFRELREKNMFKNPHYLQEMRKYLKTASTSRPELYHAKKSLRKCEACGKAGG